MGAEHPERLNRRPHDLDVLVTCRLGQEGDPPGVAQCSEGVTGARQHVGRLALHAFQECADRLRITAILLDQMGNQDAAVGLLRGWLHPDRVVRNHAALTDPEEIAQSGARLRLFDAGEVDDRRRAVLLDRAHGALGEDLVLPVTDNPVDLLLRVLALLDVVALQLTVERLHVVGRSAPQDHRDQDGGGSGSTTHRATLRFSTTRVASHRLALSCTVASLAIS